MERLQGQGLALGRKLTALVLIADSLDHLLHFRHFSFIEHHSLEFLPAISESVFLFFFFAFYLAIISLSVLLFKGGFNCRWWLFVLLLIRNFVYQTATIHTAGDLIQTNILLILFIHPDYEKPRVKTNDRFIDFTFICALAYIYFYAIFFRNWNTWSSGGALNRILWDPGYSSLLTESLREYFSKTLVNIFVYGMYFFEIITPAMLILSLFWKRLRVTAVVFLVIIHLGIFLLFDLGAFPWIMIALGVHWLPDKKAQSTEDMQEFAPVPKMTHSLIVCLALLKITGIFVPKSKVTALHETHHYTAQMLHGLGILSRWDLFRDVNYYVGRWIAVNPRIDFSFDYLAHEKLVSFQTLDYSDAHRSFRSKRYFHELPEKPNGGYSRRAFSYVTNLNSGQEFTSQNLILMYGLIDRSDDEILREPRVNWYYVCGGKGDQEQENLAALKSKFGSVHQMSDFDDWFHQLHQLPTRNLGPPPQSQGPLKYKDCFTNDIPE